MAKKRKQGEGTVRLRKDGRWEGRVVIGYDEKGLPKTKNVLAKSKTECQQKLEKLKEECEKLSGRPSKRAKPEMPFGDWIDLWYQVYSKPALRVTTQECYEQRIYNHIIPSIGHIPLNKLRQSDLQQFYAELKKNGRLTRTDLYGPGLSDRVVRGCHGTCRMALERAKHDKLIRVNPAVGCKLPPKKSGEMKVLSHDEMQRFLIQAKYDGFFELALLELSTGMRRGEICALKWSDLNFTTGELHIQRQVYNVKGELHVSKPKTKASDRVIILPPPVLNVLRELKEKTDSQWMFASPVKEDAPMSPQSVYAKMKKTLERAQCRDVRFHDLRHTFATTALEHGMDVKTLSAIIGHISSATTVDIYSHVTDAMQLQAANKIEQGFGGGEAYEPACEAFTPQPTVNKPKTEKAKFEPYKGKIRRSGTGCLYKINDHLWEGSYHPTHPSGKRIKHNVYAQTREECEAKLAEMIEQVRAEIEAEKKALKEA